MCDCQDDTTPSAPAHHRRLKLGEISPQWHCTIIGTCLSMAEIRAVAEKYKIRFVNAAPSEYEIHTAMVKLASRDRAIGKALHKILDRKHATAIRRLSQDQSADQVMDAWKAALAAGDVAGSCWAVMSHPATTEEMRVDLFGQIHMLSHQVGSSARADLRRIFVLEREKADLERRAQGLQDRLRDEIRRRDQRIGELSERLDCEMAETRRLSFAAEAAARLTGLEALAAELQQHLDAESRRRALIEDELRDAMTGMRDLTQRLAMQNRENEDLREDIRVLENRLPVSPPQSGPDSPDLGHCADACRNLDLCGRCILFVGGRQHHVQHLRRLVEESNGTLLHHDGGTEESVARLHGLFGRADAVLLPVDAVSHMAHDEVKKLCRKWAKPFVPVRRSGLGAIMRALHNLSDRDDGAVSPGM